MSTPQDPALAHVGLISDIRFATANAVLRSKGLLGWVCCVYGDLRLDGLAVRRVAGGGYALSFPSRTDERGERHPYYLPLSDAARVAIEAQVIAHLRRGGWIT